MNDDRQNLTSDSTYAMPDSVIPKTRRTYWSVSGVGRRTRCRAGGQLGGGGSDQSALCRPLKSNLRRTKTINVLYYARRCILLLLCLLLLLISLFRHCSRYYVSPQRHSYRHYRLNVNLQCHVERSMENVSESRFSVFPLRILHRTLDRTRSVSINC